MRIAKTVPIILLLLASIQTPARADWQSGVEALKGERFAEAAALFRGVVETHPDYGPAWLMLGHSLEKLAQPGEAAVAFERAVELVPDEASYRLAWGRAQLAAGQAEAALATLHKLSLRDLEAKRRPAFAQSLAQAAHRLGQPERAAAVVAAAELSATVKKELWLALGATFQRLDEPVAAYRATVRALELDRADVELGRRALAQAFRLAGSEELPAQRDAWYRRAAELGEELAQAEDSAELRLMVGEALLGAGERAAARPQFAAAASLDPNHALAHFYLGSCAFADGEAEAALQHLERALAVGPDGPLTERIQASRAFALHKLERYEEAAAAFRLAGDEGRAGEMDQAVEAAAGNKEYDQRVLECRSRQARLRQLRQESEGSLGAADLARMDEEIEEAIADCRPYLEGAT